jgi:peptidoglycan/xylan/chitin deacetylase (PgdA/CDA1 family)
MGPGGHRDRRQVRVGRSILAGAARADEPPLSILGDVPAASGESSLRQRRTSIAGRLIRPTCRGYARLIPSFLFYFGSAQRKAEIWRVSVTGGIETAAPDHFTWPGGKRVGVIFRVALEGWSDDRWPGVGPMGNPLQPGFVDLNAIQWAEYGPRRGIHRLLDILARHQIRATVLVCGVICERYPHVVRKIAEAGHEIVAHSYAMDVVPVYLSEEDERANIRRTVALIRDCCGVTPRGWISPRGTPSPNSARLLAEEGFEWHGDYLDDDLPYLISFGERSIVAAPGGMEVNDLPLSVRYGNIPRAMLDVFADTFACLRDREHGTEKIDVTVRPDPLHGQPAVGRR